MSRHSCIGSSRKDRKDVEQIAETARNISKDNDNTEIKVSVSRRKKSSYFNIGYS
jgi:hypothetical protein